MPTPVAQRDDESSSPIQRSSENAPMRKRLSCQDPKPFGTASGSFADAAPAEQPKGYRWYKVATVSLPRVAIVWFGALGFELADQYIEKDGLDYDPDLVDVWVSLKVNGSATSTKDDEGFFCPRLILHRKELK